MRYKRKELKKGVSFVLTALMVMPTTAVVAADHEGQSILANPPSTAVPAQDAMHVYVSSAGSSSSNAGNGSPQNPYNRFEDAIAHVADGGTIYISATEGAFLNAQDEPGHLPFLIDKNVTIKPANGAKNAQLSVRAGGIILGANVRFENIKINFANAYHDSIFANGYQLELINVTRDSTSRKIDLFAGSLHALTGYMNEPPIYPSGPKGIIHVETNANFGSDVSTSTFGNIYAGSMNGTFEGSAEIRLTQKDGVKKLNIGAIKASGALEAATSGMLDPIEPKPPMEDSFSYPMMGDVDIHLNDYVVSVDGTTGSNGETNVTAISVYPANIPLKNIQHLTVASGAIGAVYADADFTEITIPQVTLESGATLDLTRAGQVVNIGHYAGIGAVTLRKDGQLHITDEMSGQLQLQTDGAFNGQSGDANEGHVYLTTPVQHGQISFEPTATQSYLVLNKQAQGSIVQWIVVDKSQLAPTSITAFSIEPEYAKQTIAFEELNKMNSDGTFTYEIVEIPFQVQTSDGSGVYLEDYPIDLHVNGKQAVYSEDTQSYIINDLNLAMYFTSDGVDDYLIIQGQAENGQLAEISVGNYEFRVSHVKEDGALAEFTSSLAVTGESTQGASTVQFSAIDKQKFGSAFNVPVMITHNPQPVSNAGVIGKAYLSVNGKKIAEQAVTTSEQSTVLFDNIAITAANNFEVGNNELVVTYSGTDAFKGSSATYFVEVAKAMPILTMSGNLQGAYEYDYDGTAKPLAVEIPAKVTVQVAGETISNHREKVLYKNMSIVGATFTEEPPILSGVYETKIVVSEGASYEGAEIAGPLITIKSVPSVVKVEGVAINKAVVELTIDEVTKLQAFVKPTNASNTDIVWSIDHSEVASISEDGTVTALSEGTATVQLMTVDGGHQATAIIHVSKKVEPPTEGGNVGSSPKPPATGEVEPPTEGGNVGTAPQPPVGEGNEETAPQPPTGNGNEEAAPELPTEGGNGTISTQPPTTGEVEPPTEGGNGGTAPQPPVGEGNEETTPQPPTDESENAGNAPDSTDSETGNNGDANNEVEDSNKPEKEFKVDLEDLDETLQAKVDSLITRVTAESDNAFHLSLDGDLDDLGQVTDVIVNKDGIFITVDGQQIKITDNVLASNLDFTNARVVRVVNNKMSSVMHTIDAQGLRITSSHLNDLLITSKVNEPFADVAEDAWYHQFVEDMYNFGFTEGTTATTYSPNAAITRAEFVAMIARALEVTNTAIEGDYTLSDVKGKWYANEVQLLVDAGILTGYSDGTFKGNGQLTREEGATILLRTLQHLGVDVNEIGDVQFADLSNISAYARDAVRFLAQSGVLVNGEEVAFNPQKPLTRAEMAKLVIIGLQLSGKY